MVELAYHLPRWRTQPSANLKEMRPGTYHHIALTLFNEYLDLEPNPDPDPKPDPDPDPSFG